jgi:D-sedoheptulose 7-phosphate isomerase
MSTTTVSGASAWESQIREQIVASIAAKQALLRDATLLAQVGKLIAACVRSLRSGGKVIFAGNGGSFADAQHLSAEFTSRFAFDRAPLASLALGTNNSAISAIGNDYGYEQVFARELRGCAQPHDLFIPISTSGNSPNILAAVAVARELDIPTIGWTGQGGGRLKQQCDCLCAPATETARIQECHILVGHIMCGVVEVEMFRK